MRDIFFNAHLARVSAGRASGAYAAFGPTDPGRSEVESLQAYAILLMAEDYCSGVPLSSIDTATEQSSSSDNHSPRRRCASSGGYLHTALTFAAGDRTVISWPRWDRRVLSSQRGDRTRRTPQRSSRMFRQDGPTRSPTRGTRNASGTGCTSSCGSRVAGSRPIPKA